MRKNFSLVIFSLLFVMLFTGIAMAQKSIKASESFSATVLTDGLKAPWKMLWSPDDMLWVTKREAARVGGINPENSKEMVAANIKGVFTCQQHNNLLVLWRRGSGKHCFCCAL